MANIFATLLAVVWIDSASPNNWFWPGETVYLCDSAFRQPGPKDSMILAWCEYEPWMERWIDSGEGVYIEAVAEDRNHRDYRRQ